VHARGPVASLPLDDPAWLPRIARALPRAVPADMAVREVAGEPAGFHARFSATGRHYAYRLLLTPDPLRRRQHWLVREPLDLRAMRAAAALLPGQHDCTSFCVAASSEPGRMVCRIRRAELVQEGGTDALTLHVEADRFVHSMVRSIMGTLVEVGRGRRTPESISTILLARDRRAAGMTAPPHGLCLERVDYAR
jgi:tRNA pseudouridine38-40 synthase